MQRQTVARDPAALPALVCVSGPDVARGRVAELFFGVESNADHLPCSLLNQFRPKHLLREADTHTKEDAQHAMEASTLGQVDEG